jgi:hypothetical protein
VNSVCIARQCHSLRPNHPCVACGESLARTAVRAHRSWRKLPSASRMLQRRDTKVNRTGGSTLTKLPLRDPLVAYDLRRKLDACSAFALLQLNAQKRMLSYLVLVYDIVYCISPSHYLDSCASSNKITIWNSLRNNNLSVVTVCSYVRRIIHHCMANERLT